MSARLLRIRPHPLRGCAATAAGFAVLLGAVSACAQGGGAGAPADTAPDSFLVAFETTKGEIGISFHRDWSPAGVDRIWTLAQADHWAGARFYRVNPQYAQFGYTGRPTVDSAWIADPLPDEPVRASNVRGTVSFARGGPDSRSVILFINRADNSQLDALSWRDVLGFPPVGRVESGMEVVEALEGRYADRPVEDEDSLAIQGNSFLDRRYPGLDHILRLRIVEDWR